MTQKNHADTKIVHSETVDNQTDKSEMVSNAATGQTTDSFLSSLVSTFGYILAISYPLLALSTGVRALYQLFVRDDLVYYWPSIMSGIAALSYLVATIGFAYRRRWSWWLSVAALGFETSMTVVIGIWSYVDPDLIGRTVWRHFGEDYGYFPFFQPIIGLIWLMWPSTREAYGMKKSSTGTSAN